MVSRRAVNPGANHAGLSQVDPKAIPPFFSPVNGTVVFSPTWRKDQTVVASFQTPTCLSSPRTCGHCQRQRIRYRRVAEGKSADFRVDAYPREFFHGIVTQVRNAPISIQNVVTYDVIISVENPELKLKPGMTANISIVTARNDDRRSARLTRRCDSACRCAG